MQYVKPEIFDIDIGTAGGQPCFAGWTNYSTGCGGGWANSTACGGGGRHSGGPSCSLGGQPQGGACAFGFGGQNPDEG